MIIDNLINLVINKLNNFNIYSMEKQFRCPFEIKWEQENSILELEQGSKGDLSVIWEWIKEFTQNEAHTALRIRLSDDFKRYGSNEQLLPELIDISTEAAVKMLELKLKLETHYWSINNIDFNKLHKTSPEESITIRNLIEALNSRELVEDFNSEKIAEYIKWCFEFQIYCTWNTKPICIDDAIWLVENVESMRVLTIAYWWTVSFDLYWELQKHSQSDNLKEDGSFGFFTTPFYPESFWRYSNDINLVMTRVRDLNNLPDRVIRKIILSSNTILKENWVDIKNVETDTHSPGLWIPEYK